MRRAWWCVAVVGCAAPPPPVDAPGMASASSHAAPPAPAAPTAKRWAFPEGNVKHTAAMLRGSHLVEDALRRALKAYGDTKETCPNSEPIPSTIPTATSVALADPTSFARDPGWQCVGFEPEGKLEFQFTFRSSPPFKKTRPGGGEVLFEACGEAELVPGGRTTVVCWLALRDPVTGEPVAADRADIEIEPFDADDSPLPEAPDEVSVTEVCKRLAAIHSPRTCEADLERKRAKHPPDFACFAGCSTLEHVDDQAYCVERCILKKLPGGMSKPKAAGSSEAK